MEKHAIMAALSISLQSGLAQEPPTYKPENFEEGDVPKGMTAEEYMKQVYEERHYKIKVTFRVVGENGAPIPNADINVGIDSLLHADGYNNYRGKTNAEGLFTVESRGQGCSKVVIEKDGYYPSRPRVRWRGDLNNDRELMEEFGFRPWNPTIDVIVKEIGEPIPMIVRRGNRSRSWIRPAADQIGKKLAWDLVEGDWVAPEGDGKVADLILNFELSRTDDFNHSASVRIGMGNTNDGFILLQDLKGEESLLGFPRRAPADGYEAKDLKFTWTLDGGTLNRFPRDMPKGYLFRLRTKKDENGEITSAIYGKITKPFDFQGSSTGRGALQVNFDYYLNPTSNDRNLEYDQRNNLAPEVDPGLRWPP